jgi:hypothetical protein
MPRVLRQPHLLPLSLVLIFSGCAYLFPSCESIPNCPDAAVMIPLDDGGVSQTWLPMVLCTNLTCSDLHTDPFNCGACENVCPAGLSCFPVSDGGATCGCVAQGQILKNDECFAYAVDPMNCGRLGNVCGTNQVCVDGGCVCPVADYLDGGFFTECPPNPDAGSDAGASCVYLPTDPNNCGACGQMCGGVCLEGTCVDAGETPDGGENEEMEPDAGDGGEPDAGDGG